MTAVLARVFSMAAIVLFWGFVNRTSLPTGALTDPTVQCDLAPPRDIGGLEACLARASRDVELLIDLGVAYESAGRPSDAVSAYRRAVDADPHDADARVRLATALRRAGDLAGARREGATALALRPNDPLASALTSPDGHAWPDQRR